MAFFRYIDLVDEASAPLPPLPWWEHDDSPWTPLRKPLARCTVAILGSAGVHLKTDPPFNPPNDMVYRLIHRDTPAAALTPSHPTPVRQPGHADVNVVFPLERFRQFEAERIIGRLADEHISMVGPIKLYDKVTQEFGPAIAKELQRQGVDLLCCFPL
ncbi:MAG: hypothetical protein HYY96_03710 [Candidatus Tectomicrobia bacterium]|nr:hypothetical protein [Candidatus Tectomicrobia bacterium]